MKNLNIAINASLDPFVAGGVHLAIRSLIDNLPLNKRDMDIRLLSPPSTAEKWKSFINRKIDICEWPYELQWYREDHSHLLNDVISDCNTKSNDNILTQNEINVVHFPNQLYFRTTVPFIYEPWDLQHEVHPNFFSSNELHWRKQLYKWGCTNASLIITASKKTKDQIVELYGIDSNKIVVIYRDSMNVRCKPSPQLAKILLNNIGINSEYLFYPAQTYKHKNHEKLIESLAILRDKYKKNITLVCSGKIIKEQKNKLDKLSCKLGLTDNIIFSGPVSEEILCALYANATMLVFPSLFEGLGLPLLEAMYYKLPIAASDCSCIPEIARNTAKYFNPDDPDEISDVVYKLLEDKKSKDSLIQACDKRLEGFSWNRAMKLFIACYKKVGNIALDETEQGLLDSAIKCN